MIHKPFDQEILVLYIKITVVIYLLDKQFDIHPPTEMLPVPIRRHDSISSQNVLRRSLLYNRKRFVQLISTISLRDNGPPTLFTLARLK